MQTLTDATLEALFLLLSGDPTIWGIIGISFQVSTIAIFSAVPPALLVAFTLAHFRFPGRKIIISIFSALLSVPAVVVGLTLFIVLSRQGPLGDFRLLFTQSAMVIGQFLLSFPILVSMSLAAIQAVDDRAWETARTLGAGPFQAFFTLLYEVRFGLLTALLAGYGRIIAEVGASMMLGGNIMEYTRNIPTAIALETSKGNFAQGIALGIVLVLLSFILNAFLHSMDHKTNVLRP
ncbi:MAG: ABC transporter permease [Gammaproteobacteria bacterium]|jgi:tungstate transport system permease protein|nr:ABC transporter permease [Gammaproteobacteria bacterium]MBT3724209.1 ABC transporter permease [Gammaproteobacteria bacterium]MBT4075646.1 ABC transporter permease [Gammaproteobacteria bacterium]MBT4193114.1 ABC transporter permease [Gammaproteobacteria bacterium]MBT4450249.1 ABC transporter permease [Gammaproteobacteria bacterium]